VTKCPLPFCDAEEPCYAPCCPHSDRAQPVQVSRLPISGKVVVVGPSGGGGGIGVDRRDMVAHAYLTTPRPPGPRVRDLPWQPLATAPRHGAWLLLRGPSGMRDAPQRHVVARHDAAYWPLQPWVTLEGDSVLDGGPMPTEWCHL